MMMHSDTPADREEVEGGGFEEQLLLRRRLGLSTLLTLTADRVLLAEVGGVKEVVGRFLKGGQHEDALLHLGQSEPGDPQYFTLDVAGDDK